MKTPALLATALLALTAIAHAVPTEINYQGVLTDQNGNPVNGVRAMQLKIYDAPTGGTLLYSEDLGNVPVQDGIYSFAFGTNGTTSPAMGEAAGIVEVLSESNQPWLEMMLGGVTQTPRQKFLQVPYALVARRAEVATGDLLAEISSLRKDIAYAVGGWQGASLFRESFSAPTRVVSAESNMSVFSDAVSGVSEEVNFSQTLAVQNQVLSYNTSQQYVRYIKFRARVSGGVAGVFNFTFNYSDGTNSKFSRSDVIGGDLSPSYYIANPNPQKIVTSISIQMPASGSFFNWCNTVYNTSRKVSLNLNSYSLRPTHSKVGAFLEVSDSVNDNYNISLVGTEGTFQIPRDEYTEIPSNIGSPLKLIITHTPNLNNNAEKFEKIKTVVLRFSR
jgi:hypothetical protein